MEYDDRPLSFIAGNPSTGKDSEVDRTVDGRAVKRHMVSQAKLFAASEENAS